jgi:hypothetical protein
MKRPGHIITDNGEGSRECDAIRTCGMSLVVRTG